jgi:tetratricopeptide (TPR) repeat protein
LLKKLDYLINGYKDIFSHFKTYNLLYFLKNLITKSDLLESIEKSYDVIKSEDYSKDIGYLHLFADIVITYYEGTGKSIEDKIWLVEVEKALEKAIELKRDYAKFYSTKARLLAIKKQYDSALSEINKALQFEEDSKVFKITNYQDIKILIISDRLEEKLHEMNLETKKVTEQFEEKLRKINLKTENELDTVKNEMKESIDKVTLRSYEVIVFFIGIISLIMAAINVTSQMKPLEAIIVLMAFLGLLLCAFFCLGIIIHRRELPNNEHSGKKMPFSFNIPLILGILLIVVAVLFCISIPMNLDDNQVNNVNLENKKMPREIPAKDLTTSAEEEQQQ